MTARIFVTTYGLYNNGFQFANDKTGYWIDCSDYDAEKVFDSMLEQEQLLIDEDQTDVEIMFTDYECFPESLYSESGIDFDLIATWEGLEDEQQTIVEALVDHGLCSDLTEALTKLEDCYIFEGTRGDYAQETTEGCSDIPDYLQNYIDWDAMGRDMEIDGNMTELSHKEILITNW